MSKIAIELRNVSRMFKLHQRPFYRLVELFGWHTSKSAYEEFWALRDINLIVPRGEKLGIVGRNGAGKSTLLKLVAGQLKPTTGYIRVNGKVHALMELGTGFHPEFSGRENVISALAYMGIIGKEAQQKLFEIIEFSELEDFIDQPLKTYSSGMYARLAFAIATSVEPEILIVDEILGAGDAYFNAKATERMLKLTGGETTVLFVSHDLASVQRLCNRCIWLEQGQIIMDGIPLNVTKAYYADIRKREERRLKAKNMRLSLQNLTGVLAEDNKQLIFHFIGEGGRPPKGKVPIHRVRLWYQSELLEEIKVGAPMDNNSQSRAFLFTHPRYMNWSEPFKLDGKWVRNFEDHGGIYQHAPGAFLLTDYAINGDLIIEVEYKDTIVGHILLEVYDGNSYVPLGLLPLEKSQRWRQEKFQILRSVLQQLHQPREKESVYPKDAEDSVASQKINNSNIPAGYDIYGSGEVKITRFEILNRYEQERYVFHRGESLTFRFHYQAKQRIQNPIFVVAVYRTDGLLATQLITSERDLTIPELEGNGTFDFILDPLLLGEGEYIVSAAIFKQVDLASRLENPAYDLHDRKYHFKVLQPLEVKVELGIIYHPAQFCHKRYV